MGDLINPSGMLGRAFYLGYSTPTVGDVSLTVTLPKALTTPYTAVALPSWNTAVEVTQGATSVVFTFAVPAPAGGQVRWIIFL